MHDRITYIPITERPDLRWPGGKRMACWIVPNVEHYQYLGDHGQPVDPYPRLPHPDMLVYTHIDYGNRIGFWRMLEVFDRYRLPITCSLNMAVFEMFPEIRDAAEARGWEVMSHGVFNSRHHWGHTRDQEKAIIQNSIDRHRVLTGRDMQGFFAPFGSSTEHTEDLCAELGLKYYVDYGFDDHPTPVRVPKGQLLALPYSFDVNDGMNFRGNVEAMAWARNTIGFFDQMHKDAQVRGGSLTCIPTHPFNLGQPHRVKYLDQVLAHAASHDDVWFATGSQIAEWYYQHHFPVLEPLLRDGGFFEEVG
jgi:peptidoglycan/xylan/chitin deacetylase (PgdA/CDA1 family)